MQIRFKLKNAALLMALAAVYPLAAHSAAGVAQFAVGDVSVRRGAAIQPLAKGQAIESGDSIVTGGSGQTQLRFTDGGLVSLTPNSQFDITRYIDDNDPGKDSFAVSFLRGGMRAITGLIGKRNRENYKVTTSTATIGIRGSAFSARINTDGTLDVAGEQDEIQVCNNAGCVNLLVGEIVRVTGSNNLPRRTALRSNVPPLVARQDFFIPENPAEVTPLALPQPLPTLLPEVRDGMAAMFATGDNFIFDHSPRGGDDGYSGSAVFIGTRLVNHNDSNFGYGGSSEVSALSAVTDSGTLGAVGDADFIGWGYWATGQVSGGYSGSSSLSNVHYIVGRPTPSDQMPVTGTASYALAGGTRPTATDGSTTLVGSLLSATLSADFNQGIVNTTVNTQFTRDNGAVVGVSITDLASISGSHFASLGCGNGTVNGFFAGNLAARAGIVYGKSGTPVGLVRGAAGFAQSSSSGLSTGNGN